MSEEAGQVNHFRRLLLTARDGARGVPLGDRDTIAALLSEMIPRLTFTSPTVATLSRGQAELGVQLVGEPVSAIELSVSRPIRRLPPVSRAHRDKDRLAHRRRRSR